VSAAAPESVEHLIESMYRDESRRIYATLVRLLGDFDLAEDAMQDAFTAAIRQWPTEGVPTNPRAWLVSTGRFKAIDNLRRRTRFDASMAAIADQLDQQQDDYAAIDDDNIEDDRLRLIFTCCNPALNVEARLALTLREICGLTTEEIARSFLTTPSTLAQRIVRAKAKIRDAGIPYRVPEAHELPERLETVLQVIYLVYNEGYVASAGDALTRPDITGEAIRLARLLHQLLPEPEVKGLLALMLLHESRRAARTSPDGDLVLLENQDRSLWKRNLIDEGRRLIVEALGAGGFGPYSVQAAISAVHADAATWEETDWREIVALYDVLLTAQPSPVVALNRAAAIAFRDGPETGLALIDGILSDGDLTGYAPAHNARADLLIRLGRDSEALEAYALAFDMTRQEPERRFIQGRMDEIRVRLAR